MKIGFIGAGNMGGAIVGGMINGGSFKKEDIYVCDKIISDDIKALEVLTTDTKSIIENCDCVVLAVKPSSL